MFQDFSEIEDLKHHHISQKISYLIIFKLSAFITYTAKNITNIAI